MDSWKVVVLGDACAGKTALVEQFALERFAENFDISREDAYRKKIAVDDRTCLLEVFDTQGQEEYAALREQCIREGQGFILLYSITSRATFERLDDFRQAMLKVKGQKPVFVLVGNKCDKHSERQVSIDEGASMAKTFGCDFVETSASTAENVERLFTTLVRFLRQTEQGIPVMAERQGGARVGERNKQCSIM